MPPYTLHMSDITYEELTPSAGRMHYQDKSWQVGHYLWGIDTYYKWPIHHLEQRCYLHKSDITYEELTHRLSDVPICMSNSSDITYEELTRLSGIVKVSPFSMKCGRTLPMRNWHSPKIVIIECFILCRTLPMRNWHYPHHPQQSLHQGFVGHYLWGIDTSFFFELSDGTIDWSDITYEELTHAVFSEVVASSDTSSGRTLPMRNWHISRSYIFFIIMSDITYEELTLKNQHT